ncbi:MAG TPA: DUF4388 domain-containing protein [Anaeromyxobacteraceae bacterium]|nr:DUF4388 domain-containing protein [Anaeromyxobacteraceae bacterium]
MGSFQVMPLQDLVEFVARRQFSGALTCERGAVRKTIRLHRGAAVGAASNDPREFLGQLLINFGRLTEEQLSKAFQTQEETKVRLGKVLVMVGLVPPEAVREALSIKIRETLLDAFTWDSGVFHLDEAPPPAADDFDAAVPLAEILKEAEFRVTAWQAFHSHFPTGAATLLIDEERIPTSAREDTVDGKLLMLAVEGKTIDEIGLALHATDFHLYQRLYALLQQGVIRAAPPGAPPPEEAGEAGAAAGLSERARALLDEGRVEEAEEVATQAAELAPALEPAGAVLREAQRRLLGELSQRLLGPAQVPVLAVPPHEVGRLRLSAAEKYLLSRCDGARPLSRILQVAPLRELETLKAFRRFVESGIVELR